jgi:hypothetical protein
MKLNRKGNTAMIGAHSDITRILGSCGYGKKQKYDIEEECRPHPVLIMARLIYAKYLNGDLFAG